MAENDGGFPSGVPDESNLTPWIERLIGRSLGDVRIHDSSQAGTLAGRLGARAFAVGRDVYVRPELLRPLTPRSVALLAHELTHAAEQSGAAPVTAPNSAGLGLPHAPAGLNNPSVAGAACRKRRWQSRVGSARCGCGSGRAAGDANAAGQTQRGSS